MSCKSMSRWLKSAVLGASICVVFVYFIGVPILGKNVLALSKGIYENCYWPWLGLIWATAIPIGLSLWLVWRFAANLKMDCAFCTQNAHFLQWIAALAAGDSVLFFAGNVLYVVIGLSHVSVLFVSLMIALAAGIIAVVVTILAQLMQDAAALQKMLYEKEKTT